VSIFTVSLVFCSSESVISLLYIEGDVGNCLELILFLYTSSSCPCCASGSHYGQSLTTLLAPHMVAQNSRCEQRQSEKLSCWQLIAVYGGQANIGTDSRRDLIPRSVGYKSSSTRFIGVVIHSIAVSERTACLNHVHSGAFNQCIWWRGMCHRGLLMLKWGLLWLPGSGRLDEVQQWDRSYWSFKFLSDCVNMGLNLCYLLTRF